MRCKYLKEDTYHTKTIKMPDGGTLVINGDPSIENCQTFIKILVDADRASKT
jgi:hypothetical protein